MSDKRDPTPIVGKWKKKTLYQCRMCAFSSLDKKQFEDHIVRAHPPLRVIDGGKESGPDSPAKEK